MYLKLALLSLLFPIGLDANPIAARTTTYKWPVPGPNYFLSIPCPTTDYHLNVWADNTTPVTIYITNNCPGDTAVLEGQGIPGGRRVAGDGAMTQIQYPGSYAFTVSFVSASQRCSTDILLDPSCTCTSVNDRPVLSCGTVPSGYTSYTSSSLGKTILNVVEKFNLSPKSENLLGWLSGNLAQYSSQAKREFPGSNSTDVLDEESSSTPALTAKREIFENSKYPILAAIALVGLSNIANAQFVVKNRFPSGQRGMYVTGLQGVLKDTVKTAGKTFAAGTTWIIRYDYAENAQNGHSGGHVNVAIGSGSNRETWGFYLSTIFSFGTQNWYYSNVEALTKLEQSALVAQGQECIPIINLWEKIWNNYNDDL